jgi:(R,R)-butanediol dehydrogenase/meso-butanediol dehydrogenase/diacetyl reductase
MPEKMPAAVLRGKGELVVEEVAVPSVGEHDVLIEVSHCGVCGSDLHLVLDGWGRRGSIGGHEWSGVVVDVGSTVTRWSVGDAVIGGPTPRCGKCEMCRSGHPTLCSDRDTPGTGGEWQGAFARYTKVDEHELLQVPDGLTLRQAALAEPLAVALHGITNSGVRAGQRALVLGAGPIGALTIAALRAMDVDDIKVSEPSLVRQELARSVGARVVVAPDALEAPGPFDPGKVVDDAVDVVLECSGHGPAMEAGLAQLKRRGTLVLVGAGMAAPKFDPNRILLNELIVTGAFCYDADGFERALELLASGRMPLAELIDPNDVPLAGTLDAMNGLAGGQIAAKVMIAPGAAS